MKRNVCLLIAAAAGVFGADDSRTAVADQPVLGYVYDAKASAMRAVLGAAESPRFSEPIALPQGVSWIANAPNQDWALVSREGAVGALEFATGNFLKIAEGEPSRYAFSPSGRDLVLYSKENATGESFTGLPAQARAVVRIAAEDLRLISVCDDASLVAYVSGDGKLTAVSESGRAFLAEVQELAAVEFAAGSKALFAYDKQSGELKEFEDPIASGVGRSVGKPGVGFDLMAVTGGEILQARSSGGMRVMSRDGSRERSFETPPIRSLETMRARSLRLLSYEAGEPAWILSGAGVSAVPAIREVVE